MEGNWYVMYQVVFNYHCIVACSINTQAAMIKIKILFLMKPSFLDNYYSWCCSFYFELLEEQNK